jgi:hypothetical protein
MTYGQIILSFLRNMKTADQCDQCDQMIEKKSPIFCESSQIFRKNSQILLPKYLHQISTKNVPQLKGTKLIPVFGKAEICSTWVGSILTQKQ